MNTIRRTVTSLIAAAVLTTGLAACGGDPDQRVAYYDGIAYCPFPDDMMSACDGVRDRDGNLIPPDRWIEVDDDDWDGSGNPSLLMLAMVGHMGSHHGYYHGKSYKRHVPADRWGSYSSHAKARKASYGTFKTAHGATLKTFKSSGYKAPSGSTGYKSHRSSSHRSGGRR